MQNSNMKKSNAEKESCSKFTSSRNCFSPFFFVSPPPIFIQFEDSGLLGHDTAMIVSLVLDDLKEHGTLIFKDQAVHIL